MKRKMTKREYLRRKRKIKKIINLIVLILICVVICGAIGFMVKALIRNTNEQASSVDVQNSVEVESIPEVSQEPSEIPVTEQPTPKPTPESIQITISAAGDCTLGTDEYFDESTSFEAKYNVVDDPSYFFREVKSVFEADDLTIVNFEGTLTTGGTRKDKT